MKTNWILATGGFVALVAIGAGCSSSGNLRKFDEGDITKEFNDAEVKKFEVKDVSELSKSTPTPTPMPTPVAVKTKKGPKKKEVKAAVKPAEIFAYPNRRPAYVPFEVGEKLEYGIRYVGVTAATLNLEVLPFKVVAERKVYQIHAHAKTVKFFELVYRVDDSIDSYLDFDGLFSHRYTMDLDESKQSRKVIELYDYEKRKSFYWNRVDHVEKGFSEQKEQYDIAPWSQDPISSLYYLRTVYLPKDPNQEFRYPVIVDGKPWETVLKFIRQEKLYAGKEYLADVYSLANYQEGQLKNGDAKVWLSADEHRYVLRVEAKVKVGSFAIALDRVL